MLKGVKKFIYNLFCTGLNNIYKLYKKIIISSYSKLNTHSNLSPLYQNGRKRRDIIT